MSDETTEPQATKSLPPAESKAVHVPVLFDEILDLGAPNPGQIWIDGTAGGGGHSRMIAERLGPKGRLIAVDRDPKAAQILAENARNNISVVNASYDQVPEILREYSVEKVDGILLDLGLSSDQLADRERGFSFQTEGELDMRFDPTQGKPAHEWLRYVNEKTLADAIYQYGEERFSRRIARRIVEQRKTDPIKTADQLRELIYRCIPGARRTTTGSRRHGRVDPATRTFQALRIVVNDELAILENAMRIMPDYLNVGGKLLVMSFHSLEDRIVKYAFRNDSRLDIVTKKPVQATESEVSKNPRSRSAKLRVAMRNGNNESQ